MTNPVLGADSESESEALFTEDEVQAFIRSSMAKAIKRGVPESIARRAANIFANGMRKDRK